MHSSKVGRAKRRPFKGAQIISLCTFSLRDRGPEVTKEGCSLGIVSQFLQRPGSSRDETGGVGKVGYSNLVEDRHVRGICGLLPPIHSLLLVSDASNFLDSWGDIFQDVSGCVYWVAQPQATECNHIIHVIHVHVHVQCTTATLFPSPSHPQAALGFRLGENLARS